AGHAGDARDPAQVPMTANSVPANSGRLPMDIRPILSTLSRHKTAAALIVFEIALSCAIICNALFLISSRLERMEHPSGLAEANLVTLQARGLAQDEDAMAVTLGDIQALREIPGVANATIVNQVPFGNSMWRSEERRVGKGGSSGGGRE